MRRRVVVTAATTLAVVAGSGVAVTAALSESGDGSAQPNRALPKATGKVARGDLVDTETVDGTLGFGDADPLAGAASGTVTRLPGEGATVARGKTLYDLNGAPVTLMYGETPMYRPLSSGKEGADVEQLERNLDALGYGDGLTVDDEFTSATADAVRDWQEDRGLPETGVVDGSQVLFAPGAVRIAQHKVERGGRAQAGAPVFTVTGTKRLVRVDLDTADQQLARSGAKVTVELPDGDMVKGKISKVGTVAQPKNSGGEQQAQSGDTESTIEVDITLDDPKQAGKLDEAPVSVRMESERHEDVLSVPVEALLALREGGYGVQVVSGASVRVVSVKTGLYAEGRVEVSGHGLAEGTVVGVPSK
jgi:peptidoglycan hydrolase-like protein with peptidoglycan-binding domain